MAPQVFVRLKGYELVGRDPDGNYLICLVFLLGLVSAEYLIFKVFVATADMDKAYSDMG